jgi:chemotaxis protein histidine kinase CheA
MSVECMCHGQDAAVSTESEQTQDDFQKELIELFGQEAQEWLVQIHAALVELESLPDSDRHSQLIDAVVRGITSLGGSAATVSLPDVERATFALLPFIETIKDRTTATKQDFNTIRELFRIVIESVRVDTGITLDLLPTQEAAPAPETVLDFLTLLNALHQLQDELVAQVGMARSLIPVVMQRLEHEARQGAGQIQAAKFQELLVTIQSTDAQYLGSLRQDLPGVALHLSRLRAGGLAILASDAGFDAPMQMVARLQDIAKQTHATPLVTFLTGLQNFLTLVVQRRIDVAAHRLQSVETRILAVASMVEEWIADGQKELEMMSRLAPSA